MRTLSRCLLAVCLAALAAGPVLALPSSSASLPTIAPASAPASSLGEVAKWLALGVAVFGAIHVKDTGTLAKKFVQRAAAAAGDYKDGVAQAGADWEAHTKAAEDNYAAGTQAAIADKRFGKGVSKAGAAKFTTKATTLGAQRYPGGVQAAEGAWAQGAQPYLQAIAGMALPPRRPKGDPGNQARAQAVASALRAMKVGK